MKIGDLVKHGGLNDVVWHGIIIKTQPRNNRFAEPTVWVEWTFGDRGWFYCSDLEVVCK